MATLTAELLVLCDQAIISREGKLSIIGIFNQIFVQHLPTRFLRLFIVAIFTGKPDSQHSLLLEIKNASKKTIETRQIKLKLGNNGKGKFIAAIQGLPLKSVGTYTLSFKKGQQSFAQKKFQVIKVKPRTQGQTTLPN